MKKHSVKHLIELKGSYAIALLDEQNQISSMLRKIKVHLLVGIGEECNVVASDAMAMLQVTDQFVELMDQEIVIVTKEDVTIKNLTG